MITINLYDYRPQLKNVVIQKQVVSAVGVVIAFLFLIGVDWLVEEANRDGLKAGISETEGKIKAIEAKAQAAQKMKDKQKRVRQIIAGIRTLRTGQALTMTRLLDDVSQSVPDGVWLEGIVQAKWRDLEKQKVPVIFIKDPAAKDKIKDKEKEENMFIEIKGKSYSDSAVAHFIEELEKVPYFKTVFLFKSALEEAESSNPAHQFTVYCYMGDTKAEA